MSSCSIATTIGRIRSSNSTPDSVSCSRPVERTINFVPISSSLSIRRDPT
jgi:hypothetical protein